ncbi:MAG: DinB family protein [Ignavibacteria bacterium]
MNNNFNEIFQYEKWANNEIIKAVVKSNSPSEKVLSLMSHIINAQIIWLSRIKNTVPHADVWQLYNKNELNVRHSESVNSILNFLNEKKEVDLEKIITYENSKGEKFTSALKDILLHLSHHSAYHRGQIISLLKSEGEEFPYTDYIHYIRNIKK